MKSLSDNELLQYITSMARTYSQTAIGSLARRSVYGKLYRATIEAKRRKLTNTRTHSAHWGWTTWAKQQETLNV